MRRARRKWLVPAGRLVPMLSARAPGAPSLLLDGPGVVAYPRRMDAKPGYKTTEFWAAVAVAAWQVANVSGVYHFVSNWHSGIILTVVTAAYVVSRGIAKRPG